MPKPHVKVSRYHSKYKDMLKHFFFQKIDISSIFTSATPVGQCGIYRYGLTVENNGDIYVCPDARERFMPIGNVKTNSLSDLIKIRNAKYHLVSDPGFCFVKSLRNPEFLDKRNIYTMNEQNY